MRCNRDSGAGDGPVGGVTSIGDDGAAGSRWVQCEPQRGDGACTENPKCLLLAVASTDIHPSRLAGFAVGRSDLVIDRRNAGRPQSVHIAKRALIMSFGLGNLFLSKSGSC